MSTKLKSRKLEKGYMSNNFNTVPACVVTIGGIWWHIRNHEITGSFKQAPGETSMNPTMTGSGSDLNTGKEERQLTCKCQQY